MCYSATVRADHAAFHRLFPKSTLALKAFFDLYWRRKERPKPLLRTPKAMDALFAYPSSEAEHAIHALVEEFNADLAVATTQELFNQRKRVVDAERKLLQKTTKKALEDQRIGTNKIADALAKLEGLQRTELREGDRRIFPGWYAPVLVIENGEPVIRPMRYLCRPAGKPATFDTQLPGCYNARRDNLRGFWRGQFGNTHGLMIATAFFENVALHAAEHRELEPGEEPENVVLRFEPRPPQDMYIACLFSHWTPPAGSNEEELWSFAAITHDPPPEVADAGHDRCIVQLQPQNVAAWLTPQGRSLDELEQLLEDRESAYYEHRLAA